MSNKYRRILKDVHSCMVAFYFYVSDQCLRNILIFGDIPMSKKFLRYNIIFEHGFYLEISLNFQIILTKFK